MKKFYIAGHESLYNRGCEALVRSIVSILREQFPDCECYVPSMQIELDRAQWPDAEASGVRFIESPRMPGQIIWWSRAYKRLPGLATRWIPMPDMSAHYVNLIQQCDALIMTGGDVLSLDYSAGSLLRWVMQAETALRRQIPVVLWASSIGPFSANARIESFMARHLARYASLSTRESDSQTYAQSLGLSSVQTADPAFVLKPQVFDIAPILPEAGTEGILGFNTSHLIAKYRKTPASVAALENDTLAFWRSVLDNSGLSILLVPHVDPLDGGAMHSDTVYMNRLLAQLGDSSGRIRLAPRTLNAAQLKHLISHCRYFIGARTHSTVAALSTGVPTLSIAYSVKAKGINRDLFGDLRYLLETPAVSQATLTAGLARLVADEQAIRAVLASKIPQWRDKARHTGVLVAQALG
jgi:polysaccharide pyruvyl transferase WcaK-like protein